MTSRINVMDNQCALNSFFIFFENNSIGSESHWIQTKNDQNQNRYQILIIE